MTTLLLVFGLAGCVRAGFDARDVATDAQPGDARPMDGSPAFDGSGVDTSEGGMLDLLGPPNFDPGPCSASGWCWLLPRTTGNALRAIWASGMSDIYAVGDARTIIHFDGTSWEVVAAGQPANEVARDYHAVWGFSASDVFVGGDDGLLHFDGSAWRSHGGFYDGPSAPRIYGLWGSSRSALFAAGLEARSSGVTGSIVRFDGSRWSLMETPSGSSPRTLWGFSASDVFAAGGAGTILRLVGGAWQTMSSGTTEQINALWGASPSQLFAASQNGTILRFDGQSWSKLHQAQSRITAIWGRSSTEVFFTSQRALLRYDGTSFTSQLADRAPEALWGPVGGGPLVGAGQGGSIYAEESGTFTQREGDRASSPDVWARSTTEVYLLKNDDLVRWDGSSLSLVRTFTNKFPVRVCGQSGGGLIVTGALSIHHRNASGSWSERASPQPLNDLWCDATSDHAVTVGWRGHIEHFDGTQWASIDTGVAEDFDAVWGSSLSNIYTTGFEGRLTRYDGTSWALVPDPGYVAQVIAIAGRSASEIYMLSNTRIHRFDGEQSVGFQSIAFFGTALGGSTQHLFAADGLGGLNRLVGTQWVAEASPVATGVEAFSALGQDAWAVGPYGILLHRVLP